jgi:hypothetical protein
VVKEKTTYSAIPTLNVQFLHNEQQSPKALQAKERSVTKTNIHRTGTPKAVHL